MYLVIQHEQKGAFDVDVAGPLHLETVRLLSGGHPVPLKRQEETEQQRDVNDQLTGCDESATIYLPIGLSVYPIECVDIFHNFIFFPIIYYCTNSTR